MLCRKYTDTQLWQHKYLCSFSNTISAKNICIFSYLNLYDRSTHIHSQDICVLAYTQSLNFSTFQSKNLINYVSLLLCTLEHNVPFDSKILILGELTTPLRPSLNITSISFLDSHKGSVFSLNSVTISHTVYSLYCNNPFKFTSILWNTARVFIVPPLTKMLSKYITYIYTIHILLY